MRGRNRATNKATDQTINKATNNVWKRLGAIMLSAAIAISFMPLTGGGPAFAGTEETAGSQDLQLTVEAPDDETKAIGLDEETILKIAEDTGTDAATVEAALQAQGVGTPDQQAETDAEVDLAPAAELSGTEMAEPAAAPVNPAANTTAIGQAEMTAQAAPGKKGEGEITAQIDVSLDEATGQATITGAVSGDEFNDLYIDGYWENSIYGTEFTQTIDMRNYEVGFHDIYATLSESGEEVHYQYMVPTLIYKKPSNKLKFYTTGKNYFTFSGTDTYYYDYKCPLYLEYKKGSGKWSGPQGPMDASGSYKKKGLKANSKYSVRLYYGKVVEYNGTKYFFSGKDRGKVSAVQKMKTAQKRKPAVRSITTSGAKQYYRTWTLYYYIGGVPVARTYKVYYTSFKATLKMKKKPGTAGIYLGNIAKKGNKKIYKANFTVSGKMKGKKATFSVCTYQSKVYGGISPYYKKKVKIR